MLNFFVNIYIFWHLRHTLQTMIRHIYITLALKWTNIVEVLSWNLQYGTRCARMQRNILKERTQLVEANSKWTNHQPCIVWCLGFAVSVLPAWSSLAYHCNFPQEIVINEHGRGSPVFPPGFWCFQLNSCLSPCPDGFLKLFPISW